MLKKTLNEHSWLQQAFIEMERPQNFIRLCASYVPEPISNRRGPSIVVDARLLGARQPVAGSFNSLVYNMRT